MTFSEDIKMKRVINLNQVNNPITLPIFCFYSKEYNYPLIYQINLNKIISNIPVSLLLPA